MSLEPATLANWRQHPHSVWGFTHVDRLVPVAEIPAGTAPSALENGPASTAPHTYRPRPRSLYLIASGPRHAIASWGCWSAEGRWVWHWKDYLDRGFIARHRRAAIVPV